MVGGGEGAFIGAMHRIAARLDDHYELVAGAMSSTPEKARRSGAALGLDPDRVYDDYETMATAETARTDGVEAVAIVTPNHRHAGPTIAFLRAGVHVICDKPLALNLEEAHAIEAEARRSGRIFALTHNYSGYPLVRHMRERIAAGDLGDIRVVQAEYSQDWLAADVDKESNKQAAWRLDPARSGVGGALGDIGAHAFQLADYVTALELAEISAELTSFGAGRVLDDNAQVGVRYVSGARGSIWVSQVAPGNANGLRLRVYGTNGGFDWRQEEPDTLLWSPLGQSTRIVTRGGPDVAGASARVSRTPGGHPEGYLEAFATIYSEAALAIFAARRGDVPPHGAHFPTLSDGLRGLAFIAAGVRSSRENGRWIPLADASRNETIEIDACE